MKYYSFVSSTVILLSSLVGVTGCPFASIVDGKLPNGHPQLQNQRHLQDWLKDQAPDYWFDKDGALIGSPSFANGAYYGPSMNGVIDDAGTTFADLIAAGSADADKDMCVIRFQSLPPPVSGNFSFSANDVDRDSLLYLGDTMVQRYYDLSGPDVNAGGIIFAATTIGWGGAQTMCDAGIDTDRFCDERVLSQTVRWPQAVTGYKLNAETLTAIKSAVATWRESEDGHLESINWAFNAGNPSLGGSEAGGGELGYWGNFGGLYTKTVWCDEIPEEMMYYSYPNDTAVSDFVDPLTNTTVSEMMYQWWTEYGSIGNDGQHIYDDPCRNCGDAAPCFDEAGGCAAFDKTTGEWSGDAYALCNQGAIGCAPCYAETCDTGNFSNSDTCEVFCYGKADECFAEDGCANLNFTTGTWGGFYGECNDAWPCAECYADICPPPTDGPETTTDAPVVDVTDAPVDTPTDAPTVESIATTANKSACTIIALSVLVMGLVTVW